MFEFNVPVIEDISGSSIRDVLAEVYENVEQMVREALEAEAPGSSYEISWDENGLVVELDEDQERSEFGQPGVPMRPVVRSALANATTQLRSRLVVRA